MSVCYRNPGSYASLFGEAAPAGEQTLKVKTHFWQRGVVKHLELPRDAALDLRAF